MPNAAAGSKILVGAGRQVEASLPVHDRHKLVCSYLGLIWGPCLGVEKGCEYAAAEQQWVVAVTVAGRPQAADPGKNHLQLVH